MHNNHWDCNELPPARARMLVRGPQGKPGESGKPGSKGEAGKSAYEGAREAGYTGTEKQFYGELSSLGGTVNEAKNAADAAITAKTQASDAAKKADAAQSTAEYYAKRAAVSQTAAENATSVLDGIKDAINNIPEGDTPIINDLTTGGKSMALSAEMGKFLKMELDMRVKLNLIDNWYFVNPVNQRGQIDYGGATGYTIDRWRTSNANTGVTVADDSIFLSAAEGATPYLLQTPQAWQRLLGRTVTLSILSDGLLKTATSKLPEAVPSAATLYCIIDEYGHVIALSGKLHVRLTGPVSEGRNFTAVKLEFGAEQTLAHQENGVWVLNEIPDFGLELLKCQRYYQLFSSEATRPTALADYRPSMRVTPTTGTIEIDGVTYYYADANL